jgi:hypothetical protein
MGIFQPLHTCQSIPACRQPVMQQNVLFLFYSAALTHYKMKNCFTATC